MPVPGPDRDVPPPEAGRLRVSDAEREEVALRLRDAAGEGRLTLAEADERQARAYTARTRDDLAPLTADLPQPEPAQEPAPGSAEPAPMSKDTRPWLVLHATAVVLLAVFLLARWAVEPMPWFWPAWPLFWLAISFLVHHQRARRSSVRGRGSMAGGRRT